jgi:hypothetical protein
LEVCTAQLQNAALLGICQGQQLLNRQKSDCRGGMPDPTTSAFSEIESGG